MCLHSMINKVPTILSMSTTTKFSHYMYFVELEYNNYTVHNVEGLRKKMKVNGSEK